MLSEQDEQVSQADITMNFDTTNPYPLGAVAADISLQLP
jgi:hypothetical protein